MTAERIFKKMTDKQNETKSRFVGLHSGYVVDLIGDDIISAIKWFYRHYNSELDLVVDFIELNSYVGKRNKVSNWRGDRNMSFYQGDVLIFNVDSMFDEKKKLQPSDSLKHRNGYISPNGDFYVYGLYGHQLLEDELYLTDTIKQQKIKLDELGWVKISDNRILWLGSDRNFKKIFITDKTKRTLRSWFEAQELVNVFINGIQRDEEYFYNKFIYL